jgi:hypothetical protein
VFRRLPATAERARALVMGSMIAIGAFLIAGLFEYNFGDTEVLLVALSLMALPFVVEREINLIEGLDRPPGTQASATPSSAPGESRR